MQSVTRVFPLTLTTKPEQQHLLDLITTIPVEDAARLLRRPSGPVRSMLHRLGINGKTGREWFTNFSLSRALHTLRGSNFLRGKYPGVVPGDAAASVDSPRNEFAADRTDLEPGYHFNTTSHMLIAKNLGLVTYCARNRMLPTYDSNFDSRKEERRQLESVGC
jgi:hypothetical protein